MTENPSKRTISKKFILNSAFPQLTPTGIETILGTLNSPAWGRQAWHLHIPAWLQPIWRYLSQRERTLLYVLAERMQLEYESGLGHDRVAAFFESLEKERSES